MNNLNGSESLIREDAVTDAVIQMQIFGGLKPTGVSNYKNYKKNYTYVAYVNLKKKINAFL